MRVLFGIIAAALLLLGALNGILAPVADTCTQNSPDSLVGGVFVIGFNLAGFALLSRGFRPVWIGLIAALPSLAAIKYTGFAIWFADGYWSHGMTACMAITGYDSWELSGDEDFFVKLWVAASLTFWAGLAYSLWCGYRTRSKDLDFDQAR